MCLPYRYKIEEEIIVFLKFNNMGGYYYSADYMKDPSIESLKKTLLDIYEYICEYGIKSVADTTPIESLKVDMNFMETIHEGLALAQDGLIDAILKINDDIKYEKARLKQANIDHDENLKVKIKFRLGELYIRERMFRKLADTIAWGYFVRDHSSARRLYIGRDMDIIDESKCDEYKQFVKEFNSNKSKFGLLTDITSFIQLGDIICTEVDTEGLHTWNLIELKSGKVNRKILNILTSTMEH